MLRNSACYLLASQDQLAPRCWPVTNPLLNSSVLLLEYSTACLIPIYLMLSVNILKSNLKKKLSEKAVKSLGQVIRMVLLLEKAFKKHASNYTLPISSKPFLVSNAREMHLRICSNQMNKQ